MLVWNAMPSMVEMMSPIFADDWRIESIVCTTSRMTWPPSVATDSLPWATREASLAWSALCFTVAAICSIDAADSSRLAAVCSVRADRSMAPVATSLLE